MNTHSIAPSGFVIFNYAITSKIFEKVADFLDGNDLTFSTINIAGALGQYHAGDINLHALAVTVTDEFNILISLRGIPNTDDAFEDAVSKCLSPNRTLDN